MKQVKLLSLLVWLGFALPALAQIPNGYYDSSFGEKKDALKTAMKNIIGDPDVDSYKSLWTHFETTDNKGDDQVWDMYSEGNSKGYTYYYGGDDQCGNYSGEGSCYNREHSFPKSWFSEASPMYSDLFHLYPTDGYVNGMRSNHPFGEVKTATWTSSNGSKRGSSSYPGYSGTVFEPIDKYKGDFARTYFYMATCYEDRISNWNSDMLDGKKYPAFATWAINMLLEWSRKDPVSQKEIDRNNAVYKIQGNRNPYIDYPQLAEYVWGDSIDYAFDPTAVPEIIPVSGVALNFESLILFVGDVETLIATVLPENATNKAVSWASSFSKVATVSNTGVVTALQEGSTTIAVETEDGMETAYCEVVVLKGTGMEDEPEKSIPSVFIAGGELYIKDVVAGSEVRIYSMMGQLVSQSVAESSTYPIGLTSNSLYLVVLYEPDGSTYSFKIILP